MKKIPAPSIVFSTQKHRPVPTFDYHKQVSVGRQTRCSKFEDLDDGEFAGRWMPVNTKTIRKVFLSYSSLPSGLLSPFGVACQILNMALFSIAHLVFQLNVPKNRPLTTGILSNVLPIQLSPSDHMSKYETYRLFSIQIQMRN